MLPDFLQKRLVSNIDKQYNLPEDVQDDRNIYVTRVDEPLPIRFEILKGVLGDTSDTKTLMLSCNVVEVPRVGSRPKVVPFDQSP